jgi:hypothetical protein
MLQCKRSGSLRLFCNARIIFISVLLLEKKILK